jgi:hypothetical protein
MVGAKMSKISNLQDMSPLGGPMTPAESMKTYSNKANNASPAFDSIRNARAKEFANLNTVVSIGGGYAIDLNNGTIVFDFDKLTEEINGQPSTNQFIETLKSNNANKMFSTFQELLSDAGKEHIESLEMDLSAKKQKAQTLLKKIMTESSMFQKAHKSMDSGKVMSLLC